MKFMSKKVLFLVVMVLAVALMAGCGGGTQAPSGQGEDENVIKIGFVAPMQGDVKTFGESAKKGFELAMEQADYKAGDFTIKTVMVDDRNDATEAVNVADKLISQDQVKAIVGSITSKTTIPISEMANASGVIMVTPTATSEKVTVDNDARKDYIFRACFIDPFHVPATL